MAPRQDILTAVADLRLDLKDKVKDGPMDLPIDLDGLEFLLEREPKMKQVIENKTTTGAYVYRVPPTSKSEADAEASLRKSRVVAVQRRPGKRV